MADTPSSNSRKNSAGEISAPDGIPSGGREGVKAVRRHARPRGEAARGRNGPALPEVPPRTGRFNNFFYPSKDRLTQIERVEDDEDHGRQGKAGAQHHQNRLVEIALPSLDGSPVFLQEVSPNRR